MRKKKEDSSKKADNNIEMADILFFTLIGHIVEDVCTDLTHIYFNWNVIYSYAVLFFYLIL